MGMTMAEMAKIESMAAKASWGDEDGRAGRAWASREKKRTVPSIYPQGWSLDIMQQVSEETGVSIAQIRGKSRSHKILYARAKCVQRMREETNLTYEMIGSYAGGRDHSTIISLIRSAKDGRYDHAMTAGTSKTLTEKTAKCRTCGADSVGNAETWASEHVEKTGHTVRLVFVHDVIASGRT